ncbi:MAG: hypothetical protein FJZ58_08100 [Chlamydiae bacterium]|nr:hypothetical protein [Chlamydiota bacterium]
MKEIYAGLIYGPFPHYIDHLAPLCALLAIPLLVTEEEIAMSIKTFYPDVDVRHLSPLLLAEYVVTNFSLLFICTPRILFDEVFFFAQALHHRRIHTVWCPHGNSDKGHKVVWMETLNQERALLVYGQRMLYFLQNKGVHLESKHIFMLGNHRKEYYERHKTFYRNLVMQQIKIPLSFTGKVIVYAPTWEDAEDSSSFYRGLPALVDALPEEFYLLVKPHPNLLKDPFGKGMRWVERYEGKKNVCFLLDFPSIYSLLGIADLYIGDFSSIGYDALAFSIPMFFLSQGKSNPLDPRTYLYRCGVEIEPEEYEHIYDIIRKELPEDQKLFYEIRKSVYQETFAERSCSLQQEMRAFCQKIQDEEMDVF